MARLKEMVPLGILFIPAAALSLVVIPWAVLAPASFCPGLDPSLHPIMDGWGGDLLRMVFFHCRTGN